MAGVVAAAEPSHNGIVPGHEIDNPALPFIAPLDADSDIDRPGRRMGQYHHVPGLFAAETPSPVASGIRVFRRIRKDIPHLSADERTCYLSAI
jgi:hypothetical protein